MDGGEGVVGGGGHCSPPQSAAGTPWQSQADFRESVSKKMLFLSMTMRD